ncbi:ubiquinone/menaquinone biosynthesis C-methylase UbiE [Prauserella shujinwangii]|uniref:Ubiquinone/menaquinone biosynthesis C-methylase UbiE n=1 Tax=Prauserella shujinwangii TaxID=1453103 RepID=A0A2T0LNM1_9PSEU|nr:methyltransferase domain-containing protein [Prauserella shujinwangii]PRX44759.1 ubiquinone/menaquinone biosynthesis C-methylase UbiE [Prauserella shujinwangii]
MLEGYAPEAAGFVLPLLRSGMRVLDVGCQGGTATLSLGTAVHPVHAVGVDRDHGRLAAARQSARRAAVSTVDFLAAAPHALPLPPGSVDLAFSHALLESVSSPLEVLAELARVLRPGGTLALSTADWSRAKLRPKTANVDAALRGAYLLQRRAGGNPFAGRHVADWVERAGFRDVRVRARFHAAVGYRELAHRVEERLAAAVQAPEGERDQQLASAARSAWMWVRGGGGDFSQCWVEVLARRE